MPSSPPVTAPDALPGEPGAPWGEWARWYGRALGWATAAGPPLGLPTGLRFDTLALPADAGHAVLRTGTPTGPVALLGGRMHLLVAAGSAEELPGLLEWLQWGGITLGLTALGTGGRLTAPPPPGRSGSRGAARWLRPPAPGHEVEPTLPSLAPFGRGTGAERGAGPDLVRLLDTVATQCHRTRLLRANARTHGCANTYKYAACEYSAD
ncbi:SCO3374 family protein [Streptomyces yaizuensis]|uniref:SCO3374 family protein n=1 Tax=Streptomyces yaizuensis TaxID=2989713 RepID=A0ABQ5P0V2_9ACTN|nr:SCO3374 family protein [Streptomyces sp. YSPA8]GLF96095.1 SCO3374 family protein [Streptomyces sp. YSPA8]